MDSTKPLGAPEIHAGIEHAARAIYLATLPCLLKKYTEKSSCRSLHVASVAPCCALRKLSELNPQFLKNTQNPAQGSLQSILPPPALTACASRFDPPEASLLRVAAGKEKGP